MVTKVNLIPKMARIPSRKIKIKKSIKKGVSLVDCWK
jgi:hypothetical protein